MVCKKFKSLLLALGFSIWILLYTFCVWYPYDVTGSNKDPCNLPANASADNWGAMGALRFIGGSVDSPFPDSCNPLEPAAILIYKLLGS